MMKRMLILVTVLCLILATIPASMAKSEHLGPYNGWVNADSPFYGFKIFLQDLDESFAGNSNIKLQRQLNHADERLAEANSMLNANNTGPMEAALNEYRKKLDDINKTMESGEIDDDDYADAGPRLETHRNTFMYMINNSSVDEGLKNRWTNTFTYCESFMNGKPFVYDEANDTLLFLPPGEMKKIMSAVNGSLPKKYAKKGYLHIPGVGDCNCTGEEFSYEYLYNWASEKKGPHGSIKVDNGTNGSNGAKKQ
ncbi:hypothetical protein CUJ83_03280 [Methanocella sp. CWC-04]|uniref:DUF5667 domain-containing protein n=2 Tax=Methanooceanicella nereidis TaxID=2052831 RepID=A0AAP2RAK4_9EURY|nr:hypothetical protein [Methanocella sp. CWC-04]